MNKRKRKLFRAFTSLLLACLLLIPAAAFGKDNNTLTVKYKPGGTEPSSTAAAPIVYKVFQIATTTTSGSAIDYVLDPAYAASGVDLNTLLAGKQVADSSNYKSLLSTLSTYINNNGIAETYQKDVIKGVAEFKPLPDGLYLVGCNAATTIGNKTYTAATFLINLPYTYNGQTSALVGISPKFSTSTKPDNPPTPPPPPIIPPPPDEPHDDLPDEEPPLAVLPQTGLLWWPVPVLIAAGLVCLIAALATGKKEKEDA